MVKKHMLAYGLVLSVGSVDLLVLDIEMAFLRGGQAKMMYSFLMVL